MPVRCLKIAACYLLVGVWMGLVMGITKQLQFAAVHAHINLVGWVSLALAGLIYDAYPHAATTRLAQWHFWMHNLGLPVFMLSLFGLLSGNTQAMAGVVIGSTVVVIASTLFAVNLLSNLGVKKRAAHHAQHVASA